MYWCVRERERVRQLCTRGLGVHREDLTGVVKIPSGRLCQPPCREDTKAVLMDGPEQLPSPVALNGCVCVCVREREMEVEKKE